MLKKVFTSICLVAVSVTLGFLLLEFSIRQLLPQYDPSGQIRFTRLVNGATVGQPNETVFQVKNTGDFSVKITFNNDGFRDDKDLATATEESIFVVGDSFSFGWGVERNKRYSDVLQELTGRYVYNISIPTDLAGYERLVAYAKSKGATINTLIVGLCMENDIRRYDTPPPPPPPKENHVNIFGTAKGWLGAHSALYFFMTTIVHAQPWLREMFIRFGLIVPNLEGIQAPELDPQALSSSVERVVSLAQGQRTLVLMIPSRWLWVGDQTRAKAVSDLHNEMVAALRARGLEVIDPRPFMEMNGPPLKYHFKNDGHWRPEMHRIAAEMVAAAFNTKKN